MSWQSLTLPQYKVTWFQIQGRLLPPCMGDGVPPLSIQKNSLYTGIYMPTQYIIPLDLNIYSLSVTSHATLATPNLQVT